MKPSDLEIGELYVAKYSDAVHTVRLDAVKRKVKRGKLCNVYEATDVDTKEKLAFSSAVMFRSITKKKTSPLQTSLKKKQEVFPHLIIEARAGTGKTTTLVEGLKVMRGETSSFVPSKQQEDIWRSMELSKDASSVCFCAFNSSIAKELKDRVPRGCDAMTIHSLGYRAVREAFPDYAEINQYRVQDVIAELLGKDIHEIRRRDFELLKATQKLVNLCKMNLIGVWNYETDPTGNERPTDCVEQIMPSELSKIASHYDVELNGIQERVFDLVPKVLERCKDVARDNCIDFSDMIWLPIALNLHIPQYDLLLVDECQDLNRCQQALVKEAGRRLILVGDSKQAIYGFAGADAESMNRMKEELSKPCSCEEGYFQSSPGGRHQQCQLCGGEGFIGVITLPLNVTRRCGKAIVEEAQKYVPDFEAHESCPEGKITNRPMEEKTTRDNGCPDLVEDSYREHTNQGDMLLCRVNAPLISECFKFIRAGKKANIQGRDIGKGLISLINKQLDKHFKIAGTNASIADMIRCLSDWLHKETEKENAKRNPSESHIINLTDRYDCLCCFMENAETVDEVINNINMLFTDDREGSGIKLSSIHKAKGLEASRVFLLQPEGATIPHPMAKTKWQREQELNLLYVAITRAKEELIYVS